MHAESNATPSIEFEVAAASFLVLFVFVVDSQLGNCMLSVLVILELVLRLLFNILLEFLKTSLFLVLSIRELKLYNKSTIFLLSLLLFVFFLEAYLADPVPHGHPWTPGAHFWLIGLPSIEWGFFVGENLVKFICFSVYVPAGAFCIAMHDLEL